MGNAFTLERGEIPKNFTQRVMLRFACFSLLQMKKRFNNEICIIFCLKRFSFLFNVFRHILQTTSHFLIKRQTCVRAGDENLINPAADVETKWFADVINDLL